MNDGRTVSTMQNDWIQILLTITQLNCYNETVINVNRKYESGGKSMLIIHVFCPKQLYLLRLMA